MHAALSEIGTALSAAPAGRPRPFRQHIGMAPCALLVQHLAADGRGLESIARNSVRRGDRFPGRGPFGIAGTLVGCACRVWEHTTTGKCRQHALHAKGVAERLSCGGLCSLVNYGPGEEGLAVAVETEREGTARKISCSVSELIALTRRARLLLGGDTGPMHLAAALKIPVVAIFGPTNPARNGPFDTRSVVLRSASSVTDHSRHREPERGLLEITADEVVAGVRKLLESRAPKLSEN